MSYAIAVDIGGTFTDLVAFDHQTQKVTYAKSPTNYDNLVEGILDCFNKAAVRPAEADPVGRSALKGAPSGASLSELGYVELTPDPGEIIGGHRVGRIVFGGVVLEELEPGDELCATLR